MKIVMMETASKDTIIVKRDDCYGMNFRYKWVEYEYDEYTNRYYYLDESRNFNSQAAREGGLVRRRISKAAYEKIRSEAIKQVEEYAEFLKG